MVHSAHSIHSPLHSHHVKPQDTERERGAHMEGLLCRSSLCNGVPNFQGEHFSFFLQEKEEIYNVSNVYTSHCCDVYMQNK